MVTCRSLTLQVLQLYQITQINHGLMMVGPSGSGKSMAWRVLLKALERLEGVEGVAHIIDPKAISKDHLYGTLDPNTREWTDGLFTHVLRKYVGFGLCSRFSEGTLFAQPSSEQVQLTSETGVG